MATVGLSTLVIELTLLIPHVCRLVDVGEPPKAVVVRPDQEPVALQVGSQLEGGSHDGEALLLGHNEVVSFCSFEDATDVRDGAEPAFLLLL